MRDKNLQDARDVWRLSSIFLIPQATHKLTNSFSLLWLFNTKLFYKPEVRVWKAWVLLTRAKTWIPILLKRDDDFQIMREFSSKSFPGIFFISMGRFLFRASSNPRTNLNPSPFVPVMWAMSITSAGFYTILGGSLTIGLYVCPVFYQMKTLYRFIHIWKKKRGNPLPCLSVFYKDRTGEMAQLVKWLQRKDENLSLIHRTHKMPGMVVHAHNAGAGEIHTGGSLGLSDLPV